MLNIGWHVPFSAAAPEGRRNVAAGGASDGAADASATRGYVSRILNIAPEGRRRFCSARPSPTPHTLRPCRGEMNTPPPYPRLALARLRRAGASGVATFHCPSGAVGRYSNSVTLAHDGHLEVVVVSDSCHASAQFEHCRQPGSIFDAGIALGEGNSGPSTDDDPLFSRLR